MRSAGRALAVVLACWPTAWPKAWATAAANDTRRLTGADDDALESLLRRQLLAGNEDYMSSRSEELPLESGLTPDSEEVQQVDNSEDNRLSRTRVPVDHPPEWNEETRSNPTRRNNPTRRSNSTRRRHPTRRNKPTRRINLTRRNNPTRRSNPTRRNNLTRRSNSTRWSNPTRRSQPTRHNDSIDNEDNGLLPSQGRPYEDLPRDRDPEPTWDALTTAKVISSQQNVSQSDLLYYADEGRLAAGLKGDRAYRESGDGTDKRYKVLKVLEPSRRVAGGGGGGGARRFIQEEGAEGVVIAKIDSAPFPEFRLSGARAQYMAPQGSDSDRDTTGGDADTSAGDSDTTGDRLHLN